MNSEVSKYVHCAVGIAAFVAIFSIVFTGLNMAIALADSGEAAPAGTWVPSRTVLYTRSTVNGSPLFFSRALPYSWRYTAEVEEIVEMDAYGPAKGTTHQYQWVEWRWNTSYQKLVRID